MKPSSAKLSRHPHPDVGSSELEARLSDFGSAGATLLAMLDELRQTGQHANAGEWLAELDQVVEDVEQWSDPDGVGLSTSALTVLSDDAARLRRHFVRLLRGVELDSLAGAHRALHAMIEHLVDHSRPGQAGGECSKI